MVSLSDISRLQTVYIRETTGALKRQSGLDKRNFSISVCEFVCASSLYTERTNTATKIRCITDEGERD